MGAKILRYGLYRTESEVSEMTEILLLALFLAQNAVDEVMVGKVATSVSSLAATEQPPGNLRNSSAGLTRAQTVGIYLLTLREEAFEQSFRDTLRRFNITSEASYQRFYEGMLGEAGHEAFWQWHDGLVTFPESIRWVLSKIAEK